MEQSSDVVRILSHSRRISSLFQRLFDEAVAANNSPEQSLLMIDNIVENVLNARENLKSNIEEQRRLEQVRLQKLQNARDIARKTAQDLGMTYEEYLNSLTSTASSILKPTKHRKRQPKLSQDDEVTPEKYPYAYQEADGSTHYFKGRGRHPEWLLKQFAMGKKLEDFKNPLFNPDLAEQ